MMELLSGRLFISILLLNNLSREKEPMIRKLITIFLLTTTLILTACNVGATAAPTVDINAINTAALGTAMAQISAQQTMTALAAPTFTPSPTSTPTTLATGGLPTAAGALPTSAGGALPTVSFNTTAVANTAPAVGFTAVGGAPPVGATAAIGSVCNNLAYLADATIPDGTVFDGGEDFKKTWQVQNTGSCKWDEGYKLVYIGGDDELDPVSVNLKGDDFIDPGAVGELSVDLTAPLKAGKYTGAWRMQADNGESFGTELTVVIEVK
jgi:hypothetical protein